MAKKHFAQAKVTIKNQITIPRRIQKKLGNLQVGDYILFYVEGDRVYIKKGTIKPE